jgi:hypothetical protein
VNESRTNPANLTGGGVEGGMPRHVAKGDFMMSLHVSRPVQTTP